MSFVSLLILAVFLAFYAAFFFWYGGRSRPLDQIEINVLLSEMRRRAGKESGAEGEEPILLRQFRELAASDDGRDYWMVNLLKFRGKAIYPSVIAGTVGDDPMAANARYNRAIIPFLLKHGSHPVFASKVAGRFIRDEGSEDWDQVAAVRYRSRRDMLRMAVDLTGRDIDVHKWAALERTQVFPARPIISLFSARASVALVLSAVCAVLLFLFR